MRSAIMLAPSANLKIRDWYPETAVIPMQEHPDPQPAKPTSQFRAVMSEVVNSETPEADLPDPPRR